MNVLNQIYNFLSFVNTHWITIAAIITLAVTICKKAKAYFSKSQEEQIEIAKAQIKETMLKWVSIAERDWREWSKSGEIKRSQVIDLIFDKYPILSKVTNQNEIISWIDQTIDEALKTMRKIFEENKENQAECGDVS